MNRTATTSFEVPPPGLVAVSIDYPTGLAADASCGVAVLIPVPEGTSVRRCPVARVLADS